MTALDDMLRIGQHIWLDDISTTILDDGTLERLRDECGVTGVTANPTIFDRAIAEGAYDEFIVDAEGDDHEVFWNLAVRDVGRAADLFAAINRSSGGRTGYVSIELSPRLARSAVDSVRQGVELSDRIARDNVMIKVPGTAEGIDAIEELTFRGINVNVTLLFGISQWQAARRAYERGMHRRRQDGRSMGVTSVASFFLSRIDAALDGDLPDELRHRAAVLSAAAVQAEWRDANERREWRQLADDGALPQQLLWASTSPKTDDLAETDYVAQLVAPDSVATLKRETLDTACGLERLDISRLDDLDRTSIMETLSTIERRTRPLVEVADELQRDGLRKFTDSFDSLLSTIREVRRQR
ncbi:MAG: transaldolase family protein [Ilumatobacteraceae bacterium]|nr:transaldolase family protein [Ilumatobacteraceae bacterium]